MKIILAILISCVVWAGRGNEKGNGGNFLACSNGSEIQYQLLDFFEEELTRPPAQVGSDWVELIEERLYQLRKISPLRAENYRQLLEQFKSEARFLESGNFSSSDDVGPIMVPSRCQLVQGATQIFNFKTSKTSFFINLDIWNKIDAFQKAGLVLHEIILTEAVESGHTTSKRTRNLNAMIWKPDFVEMSASEFQQSLRTVIGMRYVDQGYYWLEIYDDNGQPRMNEFWPDGTPRFIYSRPGVRQCSLELCWVTARSPDGEPDLGFHHSGPLASAWAETGILKWQNQDLKIKGPIEFHNDGSAFKVQLASKMIWKRGSQELNLNGMVFFSKAGDVLGFTYDRKIILPIHPNGSPIVLVGRTENQTVTFHSNGVLRRGYLQDKLELINTRGEKVKIGGQYVEFTEEGLVVPTPL